ncbi:hypothetical protein [Gemmobacter denitrificans]|uniref:Uncharacterized protein n=1 Tax=Gemmobacter denitrificans TaxID=3123040 RepID=A0ABU8BV05_9RHOB
MQTLESLSAADVARLVQDLGTPVAAPLAMPKQVLEAELGLSPRGLLARLVLLMAPRQEL